MQQPTLAIPQPTGMSVNRSLLANIVFGLVLTGFLVAEILSQQQFAPVGDEMANIPGGVNYLATGRCPDPTQPPLLRYLMAVPLFIVGADALPDDETGVSWAGYGNHFMYKNRVSWQQMLFAARSVVILLSAGLLWFVFGWARRLWGERAAVAALLFLAFEPNFLGHGQLATLDSGLSLALLFAAFSLWRYLERPSWGHFLLLNLAVGMAFMTKFSAVSLFFSTAICLFLFRKKRALFPKRFLLAPLLLGLFFWATYLFQVKTPVEDSQIAIPRGSLKVEPKLDALAAKLGTTTDRMLATPIPAYDLWKGFGMQVFHAMFQDLWKKKGDLQYLNGEYSARGWRAYFAWTFLLKSTIASIVLLAMVAFLGIRDWAGRRFSPDRVAACLFITPVVLFVMCSLGTINIGHRYILPVYPFLAMGVGFLAARREIWVRYAVPVLLLAHIGSSCAAWPDHLAYFNELSRNGYRLNDSNIDWGQDLLRLQKDLNSPRARATHTCGDFFGQTQPADIGINLRPIPEQGPDSLPPGPNTIYLSLNHYLGRNRDFPNGTHPWLNGRQPTRWVGSSVMVFEIDK